jgi:hypothetical protein
MRLASLPESGMGYQRVDVRFADGRELKNAMVFNAEDLDVPNEFARTEVEDISIHPH